MWTLVNEMRLYCCRLVQVTLPSLKDSVHIAAIIIVVAFLAVTSLPVLLTAGQDAESAGAATVIRYAVGATAICLSLIITVSFLFVPKVTHPCYIIIIIIIIGAEAPPVL